MLQPQQVNWKFSDLKQQQQDKYTMDPRPQIYLSNNKNILVKNVFEQQNQKKIEKKKFFRKNLEKTKFGKIFFQLQVTIPSAYPVQIWSRSDNCITLS